MEEPESIGSRRGTARRCGQQGDEKPRADGQRRGRLDARGASFPGPDHAREHQQDHAEPDQDRSRSESGQEDESDEERAEHAAERAHREDGAGREADRLDALGAQADDVRTHHAQEGQRPSEEDERGGE
jgi:hypothetical protein